MEISSKVLGISYALKYTGTYIKRADNRGEKYFSLLAGSVNMR